MLKIWPQTLLPLTWCAVLLSNFGARLHNTLGKDLLLMYCLIAWKNLAAFHQMGYLISKEKYWDWKHVMLCLCEWHDSQHSIPNYKTQFWNPSIIKKVIYIWHFRISWNGTSSNSLMLSMTQLLTHTVAHSTSPSFWPKTNNQPTKKF